MAALHAKPVKPDTVADAAARALTEAEGDVRRATALMERAVRGDLDLRVALTDPLLSNACYDAVRKASQGERRKAWKAPVEVLRPSRVSHAHRVVQLGAGQLLMFPLPGGRKLGEATREEITAAAGFFETQAGDMAHKARWLRLVAQSVPGEKKAGEALTEKRLRELQDVARDG